MAREKVIRAPLYQVATQTGDLTIGVGGTSLSGAAATTAINPMVGDRLWNSVAAAVYAPTYGGSWTVSILGTVAGITQFTLASSALIGTNSDLNFPLTNTCSTGAMPTPTHVLWDNTAAGGITGTVNVVAKTYRGSLSSGPSNSFRVVEGILYTTTATGGSISATTTIDLSANPASGGTFGNYMGLDKYYLWDACNFYVDAVIGAGTWAVDVIGLVGGQTCTLAKTATLTATTKTGLTNQFDGPTPRPSQIIFTEVTGGSATFRVAAIAKAHRGQRFKI